MTTRMEEFTDQAAIMTVYNSLMSPDGIRMCFAYVRRQC